MRLLGVPTMCTSILKRKKKQNKKQLYQDKTDLFVTIYQQFIRHQLLPDEMVDVYLVDLWKLSALFRGMNDQILEYTFVA